jgi:hypothetical protein
MVRLDEATLNDPCRIATEKFQPRQRSNRILWITLLKAARGSQPPAKSKLAPRKTAGGGIISQRADFQLISAAELS